MEKLLTGDDSKIWIFEGLVLRQSGRACDKGDAFEFYKNKRVKTIQCQNGKVVENEVDWLLEMSASGLDHFLIIGGKRSSFSIVQKKGDTKYQYLRIYEKQSTGERVVIREYKWEVI